MCEKEVIIIERHNEKTKRENNNKRQRHETKNARHQFWLQQRRWCHCAAHTCVHCTHIGSNTWGPMHNSMHTHVALNFYFGILQPANSVKYCRFVIELNSFFFVVSAPCLCVMLSNWDWGEIRSTQRNLECKTTQTNTFQISTHLIFTQDFILLRSLLQPCVLMLTSFSSFSLVFLRHLFFLHF